MKLGLIGVGQAGGKLLDEFLAYDANTGSTIIRSAIAVNTASADLKGLEHVPREKRVLIGQSRVKGHGVGGDNELGASIMEENIEEVQGAIDTVADIDAFLVVSALGGGTGSGGSPVLIRRLQELYEEPVYALGVLPAGGEGGLYSFNAARSLRTVVREADNLFLFDNDAWRETGESVDAAYETLNEALVRRFGMLFSAGEVDATADVAQSVVDSSEIINTLAGGGISSVGYAVADLPEQGSNGLLSRFSEDESAIESGASDENRITSLVRSATLGRLTCPAEVHGAERALVVVAGPPEYLNRKGIERSRAWLEEETGSLEVRGGDYPIPDETKVAAAVVLSGLSTVPRVEELQDAAVETQETIEEQESRREEQQANLMDDDLDPLF